ncbi:MAG: hypothetical protein IJW06_02855 [Clostridia bacterium]|nr:hypothetical protein [Clostridia bacterium]
MKKITKENSFPMREGEDAVFDPVENLYNNPYENESLTFRVKRTTNSKGQTFLKKLEKKSFDENFEENPREIL